MGELKDWLKQDWVRIDSSGNIKGPCGTSKDKKILTDAYRGLKHKVSQKLKEQRRQKEKTRRQKRQNGSRQHKRG